MGRMRALGMYPFMDSRLGTRKVYYDITRSSLSGIYVLSSDRSIELDLDLDFLVSEGLVSREEREEIRFRILERLLDREV